MDAHALDRNYTLLQPVHHTHCRICHGDLAEVLSLGPQYPSDFPASAGSKPYPAVPLTLVRCTAPACGLVQLADTTPSEWMYQHYWYRSGVNETMRAELRDVVKGALRFVSPGRHLTVADIGANDGTLLSLYPEVLRETTGRVPGLSRIAWEPARNLYAACRPHAEVLFPEFFSASASGWHGDAQIVTSIAMFYDLEDPHAFVGDVAHVLNKAGVWVIQQAYLPEMLDAAGYDNVGHEHLEYYHLKPLQALLAAYGLEVFDVEHRAINGGSFRTYVGWAGRHPVAPSVAAWEAAEARRFDGSWDVWTQFSREVRAQVQALKDTVEAVGKLGPVDIYGASTKGNTLLQTVGLDARVIRQAWERSEEKYGRYVGVSGIPIVPEAEGRSDPPAALLVLPWGFRDAFVAREAAYLRKGGRLVFPLPTVEVIRG